MNVHAVISVVPNPALGAWIAETYPDDHKQVSDTAWLVAANGTAVEVSGRLGITAAQFNGALVIGISTYYGRAPMDIWDWIKTKLEAPAELRSAS